MPTFIIICRFSPLSCLLRDSYRVEYMQNNIIELLFHAKAFACFDRCVETFFKKPQVARVTTLACILK